MKFNTYAFKSPLAPVLPSNLSLAPSEPQSEMTAFAERFSKTLEQIGYTNELYSMITPEQRYTYAHLARRTGELQERDKFNGYYRLTPEAAQYFGLDSPEYRHLLNTLEAESGFNANVYIHPAKRDFVLIFEGTDPSDFRDLAADARIVVGDIPRKQLADAKVAYEAFNAFYERYSSRLPNATPTYLGFSLGGYLLALVSPKGESSLTITFNSPPAGTAARKLQREEEKEKDNDQINKMPGKMIHINTILDPVSVYNPESVTSLQWQIDNPGTTYFVKGDLGMEIVNFENHRGEGNIEQLAENTIVRIVPPRQF